MQCILGQAQLSRLNNAVKTSATALRLILISFIHALSKWWYPVQIWPNRKGWLIRNLGFLATERCTSRSPNSDHGGDLLTSCSAGKPVIISTLPSDDKYSSLAATPCSTPPLYILLFYAAPASLPGLFASFVVVYAPTSGRRKDATLATELKCGRDLWDGESDSSSFARNCKPNCCTAPLSWQKFACPTKGGNSGPLWIC